MIFKLLILGCLWQSILGISISDQSQQIDIQKNGVCQDFVPPVSYPLAWRNKSVVESRHGVKVRFGTFTKQIWIFISIKFSSNSLQKKSIFR